MYYKKTIDSLKNNEWLNDMTTAVRLVSDFATSVIDRGTANKII